MKSLRGKVAVVTGAASGIGLALAERFATEGMTVVMADIEAAALAAASDGLRRQGATVLASGMDPAPSVRTKATSDDPLVWMIRTCRPEPARSTPVRLYVPVRVLSGVSG